MAAGSSRKESKRFIVEHLDPELGDWSALEYRTIALESYDAGVKFCLSSVPPSLTIPDDLRSTPGFETNSLSIETTFANQKDRVCLLDPQGVQELSPEDADRFDVFVFGGILGTRSCPRDRPR
jgi:ribosome biogenesis SPOUT family RNA methylase Rps3